MLTLHLNIITLIIYIIIFTVNGKDHQPVVEYYNLSGIQYVLFSQRVTWEEASMLCMTYDAKLAILDNMNKATAVAEAMAESNIGMEDAWLGGRRSNFIWSWIDSVNSTSKKYKISLDPDIEDFPPWIREPTRPTKECLAIDRRTHSQPNFIDLNCRLLKPFVCEKKPEDSMNIPVPSKWVQIHKNTYTLYHGKVTWTEALGFCRSQGTRLAVVKNQHITQVLASSMTKSRPDFENIWIGARFSNGQWMWLSTGSTINLITDESGYPPWRFGKSEKNSGCLMLDRHLDNVPNFIEMMCDRKRDFVCEDYSSEDQEEWMNEPIKFSYGNTTFIIYPVDKTWDESRLYCQDRGSILAHLDNLTLANLMVSAMGDHPKEISHIWLGGLYQANRSEWRWIHNDEIIPEKQNNSEFPPWAQNLFDLESSDEEMSCLNLDRTDHAKPHFYGLNCDSKQPFACIINCEVPPPIRHGNWSCHNNSDVTSCSFECETDYFMLGLKDIKCSYEKGWYNTPNWLEFPLCLDAKNYVNRIVRSISQEMQKSMGYYILLSNFNIKIKEFSLQFVEKLLNIFPLGNDLKMGMTNYISSTKSSILYKYTNTCEVLKLIASIKNQGLANENILINENDTEDADWSIDILKNNRQRTLIIAIVDSASALKTQKTFEHLRLAGHYVLTIGLSDEWESLWPITTIGFDKRLNLYLFNEQNFETFIKEFTKIKSKPPNCPNLLLEDTSTLKYTKDSKETDEMLNNTEVGQMTESIVNLSTTESLLKDDFKEESQEKDTETKPEESMEKNSNDDLYRKIYMGPDKVKENQNS